MTLVTNFERAPDGTYLSIEQDFDGNDIPEGSTFVGFDAVAFARSTGQVALFNSIEYDTIEDSKVLFVENTDERWEVWSTIENGDLNLQYYGLGPAMINALVEHGLENPELTPDCIKVEQRISVIRGIHYIAEGPLELISDTRSDNDSLPLVGTDVGTTPEIDLLSAISADPNDYLL